MTTTKQPWVSGKTASQSLEDTSPSSELTTGRYLLSIHSLLLRETTSLVLPVVNFSLYWEHTAELTVMWSPPGALSTTGCETIFSKWLQK